MPLYIDFKSDTFIDKAYFETVQSDSSIVKIVVEGPTIEELTKLKINLDEWSRQLEIAINQLDNIGT